MNDLDTLHATPVTETLDLERMSEITRKGSTLKELSKMVHQGRSWLARNVPSKVLRFNNIL